jgi:hypothetical protein
MALARSHRARSHHKSHHARTHHSVRHKQFGRTSAATTTAPSDNAGTVLSFDPATNKLVIQLNSDNSPVSGTVTPDTQIECDSASTSSNMGHDFAFRKNDHGGGGGDNSSASSDQGDNDDQAGNSDQGDSDDQAGNSDQGDSDDNSSQSCGTSSLTPGAIVHEAELRLSGAGATWDKVNLITSSSSSSSSGN